MEKYVALICSGSSQSEADEFERLASVIQHSYPDWAVVYHKNGIFLARSGRETGKTRVYILPDEAGVLIGRLFYTASANAADRELILDSRARGRGRLKELLRHCWGHYVGFISDGENREKLVFRDPSGGILCFHAASNGIHVFFPDVRLILDLLPGSFTPNWTQLAGHFVEAELVNGRTALNEIDNLRAGECISVKDNRTCKYFPWDPYSFADDSPIEDPDVAAAELKRVCERCIGAWAQFYDGIVHSLSGGLDSAIVLACLAKAKSPNEITCLNYRTATKIGDEREFARLVAQQARAHLVEYELPGATTRLDSIINSMPLTIDPPVRMLASPVCQLMQGVVAETGAQAITTGEGGDHLFYQMKLDLIAADYMFAKGLAPSIYRVVLDTARHNKSTFWSTLATALELGLFKKRWNVSLLYPPQAAPFLSENVWAELSPSYLAHPWSAPKTSVPPGKIAQISALPGVLHRLTAYGFSEIADVINPILSQPLLELCLKVPSYVLTTGGIDRGLARKAFAEGLPTQVTQRTSKGATGNYASRIFIENLSYLREYILDGVFASSAIVDREALEQVLTAKYIAKGGVVRPLLKVIATEAWLRKWRCDGRRDGKKHGPCAPALSATC